MVWLLSVVILLATRPVVADEVPPLHFAADHPVDLRHIALTLDISLKDRRVEATARLHMTPRVPVASVTLDAVGFELRGVRGQIGADEAIDLPYAYDGKHLTAYFPRSVPRGAPIIVTVRYIVDHPKSGLHFFSPSDANPTAPYLVWSQGESIENRYWIPCFDQPSEMQTSEITATVDPQYVVLSNGRLIALEAVSDGHMTYHWLQEQPHASYLITLVAGDFAIKQETWRGKPVMYYVPPDHADEIEPTFRHTKAMLDFFSDALGVEYPWDKYAQVCCYSFGGGMENTSATTLGLGALHTERELLDGDADSLISHEMAHQWFGDLVTCRDWAHLWLNEGFASYFEALWDEHHNGEQAFAHNMANKLRGALRGGKKLPIVDRRYKSPDAQFDSRAYPKGAWVVHMLRRRLGDDLFWKCLNEYLQEHRHQPVETDDLRRTIERVSGRSFERFFYDWTARPGAPEVDLKYAWNASDGVAEVTVEQTQEADAFVFPLVVAFYPPGDGAPVVLRRQMNDKHEKFLIPLPFRPVRIAVDPRQEVLMDLTETKPRDLWIAQFRDDPNPAARIRALRKIADDESDRTRKLVADRLAHDSYRAVRSECASTLADLGGPIARDALLAGLKDKDARVRAACVAALEDFDKPQVRQRVAALLDKPDESYGVIAAALSTLAVWEPDEIFDRVQPMLAAEDQSDEVRGAAIEALGKTKRPEAVDLLIPWTTADHPTNLRRLAISSLQKLVKRAKLDDAQRDRAVLAIASCLDAERRWLRMRAAGALGALGDKAAAALDKLHAVSKTEENEDVKDALAEAIDKITPEAGEPVAKAESQTKPVSPSDALRKQIKQLQADNAALRKKLETLEASLKGIEALLRQRPAAAASSGRPIGTAGHRGSTSPATP